MNAGKPDTLGHSGQSCKQQNEKAVLDLKIEVFLYKLNITSFDYLRYFFLLNHNSILAYVAFLLKPANIISICVAIDLPDYLLRYLSHRAAI